MLKAVSLRATILAIACTLSATAYAVADSPRQIDIPAGDLAQALLQLSKQYGADLVYRPEQVYGLSTRGAHGEITTEQAVKQLLEGTSLKLSTDSSGAMFIGAPLPSGKPEATPDRTDVKPADDTPDTNAKEAQKRSFWDRFRMAAVDQGSSAVETSTGESQAGSQESSAPALEEIVVTAQKRVERLIDVPQSVSVLTADSLAKLGATQFRDFANTIPGLNFNSTGAGFTQIALRGVTTGYDVGQTVAIYIDEVPYGSSTNVTGSARRALDVGLFDLNQLEVLKGPQGTLYGASAMGGLIKYVTKTPDMTRFGGETQLGIGSTQDGATSYNGAAAVNLPIVEDKIAARVSGFYSHDGGYLDNAALGQEDVDRSNIYGGRVDLLFKPTDALGIRLNAFAQDIARDGQGTADFSFTTRQPLTGELEQRRLVPEPFEQRYRLGSATVTYDFDAATLTSITSYQTVSSDVFYDLSVAYFPILATRGRTSYGAIGFQDHVSTDKFVQETRLASRGKGVLGWAFGGFYTHESSDFDQTMHPRDLAGQPAVNDLLYTVTPSTYDEYAAFGDLTWYLTSKLDVTGGLRYSNYKEKTERVGFGLLATTRPVRRSDEDVLTYLANARYHLDEDATVYLRYATGYRPGGVNLVLNDPLTGEALAQPTYEADRLRSYELGFKGETDSGRFGADLSMFYIDWSNVQISAVRNQVGVRINAPEGATVRGAELAFTARPIETFTLSGALAWQDAHISEASSDVRARAGERLPNVPRFTGTLNGDYTFAAEGLRPTIGATVRYVSDRRANFDAGTAPPQYILPEYNTVDLRAALTFGSVTTQLYVRNVLDERAEIAMFNWNSAYAQAAVLQPRTIGVVATLRF